MALASTTIHRDVSRRRRFLVLNVTASGNYPTGGDVLDFTKTTNPKFLSAGTPASIPTQVEFLNEPGGYSAHLVPGTTMANAKVKFLTPAGAEVTAGAYPAALSGELLQVRISGSMGNF